jgi:sulfonate transport system ATP-binding protein
MQELFGRLRARHGFAALLVTLDVDEVLLLADRALGLADGRIQAELPVALEYPRAPDVPGFAELRRELLDRLGVPLPAARRPVR